MAPELLSRVRGEIEARMRELRPLVAEYERLLAGTEALGPQAGLEGPPARRRGASPPSGGRRRSSRGATSAPSARPRAPRGAAEQAIIAALEHGSHTAGELAVVTAMSRAIIRDNLRRLQRAGTVGRTRRRSDGKAAYALSRRAVG